MGLYCPSFRYFSLEHFLQLTLQCFAKVLWESLQVLSHDDFLNGELMRDFADEIY